MERDFVWDSFRTDSPVIYKTAVKNREFNHCATVICIERYLSLNNPAARNACHRRVTRMKSK